MYTIGPLRVEVSKRLKKIKINKKTFQLGLLFPPGDLPPSVHHGDPRPSPPRRTGPDHRQSSSTVEKVQPSIWFFGSFTIDVDPSRSEMVGKMVNGTGLTDDRRVSEQVRIESESENYILNSSKGLAERDR